MVADLSTFGKAMALMARFIILGNDGGVFDVSAARSCLCVCSHQPLRVHGVYAWGDSCVVQYVHAPMRSRHQAALPRMPPHPVANVQLCEVLGPRMQRPACLRRFVLSPAPCKRPMTHEANEAQALTPMRHEAQALTQRPAADHPLAVL